MFFKKVLDAVETIRVRRSASDRADGLNHRWTSVLLVVSCLLLTTANYGSVPMFCWCPAYFVSAYEKYAQKICWVSETYNIVDDRSQESNFPAASRHDASSIQGRNYDYSTSQGELQARKKVLRVSYYQWIPLLLLLQSFFFYLPGLIWKTLAARSGLDLANIVEASDTVQNAIYPERREKTLRYMSRHINRFLTYQNNFHGGCCRCLRVGVLRGRRFCFCCGNRFGNYLSCLYLGLKLVNVANIIFQVLFIDFYLGSHFHLLGVAFLHGVSTNRTVETATAIASNHPAIAHVLTNSGAGPGNTGYSSSNVGHVVKRDVGGNVLFPSNESSLMRGGSNTSDFHNFSSELRPERTLTDGSKRSSHRKLTQFNSLLLERARSDFRASDNNQKSRDKNLKMIRSRRDARGSSHSWSQKQRKHKRRPHSGTFDWSTYIASLRSFPYLSSKLFPKITYCDFTVRQMTTLQLFTTQCVLSINFINEKLFLLLWFWFCLLFLVNVYSLVVWSIRLCSRTSREHYVRRRLAMIQHQTFFHSSHLDRQPQVQTPSPAMVETTFSDFKPEQTDPPQPLQPPPVESPPNKRMVKFEGNVSARDRSEISYEQAVKSFVHCRLKQDGVFILKILATNTTRLVELDVLALLWSVHERRMATSDPYYNSDRRESTGATGVQRRDTVVDVTELRKARTAMPEHELQGRKREVV